MLRRLSVTNFRSIREAAIEFSPTGLTVIVGANGSGKSNLVKSLEFLSSVSREGLAVPIQRRGREGFVPKEVPEEKIENLAFGFRYDFDLPRFPDYPIDAPSMRVSHDLRMRYHDDGLPTVDSEELTFFEPLLVQHFLRTKGTAVHLTPGLAFEDLPRPWQNSRLVFRQAGGNQISVEASPAISADNVAAYLKWFNLTALEEHFQGSRARTLLDFLSGFAAPQIVDLSARTSDADVAEGVARLESFLDRNFSSIVTLAPEFDALRRAWTHIRRYDLQLTELRREQRPQLTTLSREGRGMPGAIRRLQTGGEELIAWQRIVGTMSVIAPHVLGTQVSNPTPDKEFIEFIESRVGRPVESWESSDGTLRALATLVALERHPASGTIVIEEPEQGLHPWAITALMEHIRDAIRLRGLQVILTTHSQQVLEAIEPEELLVAERSEQEGTRFLTLAEILPRNRQVTMGEVGRLWVKGLLRGVPTVEARAY